MPVAIANTLITKLSPPPIPSVHAWGRAYDGSRGALIDLSQAVPGYPTHPEMLRLLGTAAASPELTGYGPIEGETVLRKAYAEHGSAGYGADVRPENIHVTAGCNQAFMCTSIALTNPFFFNHETTLSMLGIRHSLVECNAAHGFLPDIASAEAALAAGAK